MDSGKLLVCVEGCNIERFFADFEDEEWSDSDDSISEVPLFEESDSDATDFEEEADDDVADYENGKDVTSQGHGVRGSWDQTFVPPDTTFAAPDPKILVDINLESSPLDILQLFLTEEMMDSICHETNRYAENIKSVSPQTLKNWVPLEPPEIWRFLALIFLMGIDQKPSFTDYWSQSLLHTPIFPKIMPRQRYSSYISQVKMY